MDNYSIIFVESRSELKSVVAEIFVVCLDLFTNLFERHPQLQSIYYKKLGGYSIMIVNNIIAVRVVDYKIIVDRMKDKLPDMIREDISEEELYTFISVIGLLNDGERRMLFNSQNEFVVNRDFINLMNREVKICP